MNDQTQKPKRKLTFDAMELSSIKPNFARSFEGVDASNKQVESTIEFITDLNLPDPIIKKKKELRSINFSKENIEFIDKVQKQFNYVSRNQTVNILIDSIRLKKK